MRTMEASVLEAVFWKPMLSGIGEFSLLMSYQVVIPISGILCVRVCILRGTAVSANNGC